MQIDRFVSFVLNENVLFILLSFIGKEARKKELKKVTLSLRVYWLISTEYVAIMCRCNISSVSLWICCTEQEATHVCTASCFEGQRSSKDYR